MRCALYLAITIVLAFVVFVEVFYANNRAFETKMAYNLVTLGLFAMVAFFLVVALGQLIFIVRKNFHEELCCEQNHVIICQSIFVVSFLVRVVLIGMIQADKWVDFTRDYPLDMKHTAWVPL